MAVLPMPPGPDQRQETADWQFGQQHLNDIVATDQPGQRTVARRCDTRLGLRQALDRQGKAIAAPGFIRDQARVAQRLAQAGEMDTDDAVVDRLAGPHSLQQPVAAHQFAVGRRQDGQEVRRSPAQLDRLPVAGEGQLGNIEREVGKGIPDTLIVHGRRYRSDEAIDISRA